MKVSPITLVRNYLPPVHSIVRLLVLVKYKSRYCRTSVAMHKKGGTKLGTLYENITSLCKSKGVSGSRMCLDLGLSKSTMSDLKNGRIKGISIPTAQKIAGYFGISVDELYGEEAKKEQPTELDGLSEKRKALMQFAMSVPDDKADMILQVMKTILKDD